MSRLADFFDTGTIARLPIVADLLTGNIQGLEYSYTSAHSITITKGNCYDSFNLTVLTGSASQVVAIGTTINKVYNLFLCDDGLVKTDTDVDGATLLAGSVTALRWIGFVRTNSSGAIMEFMFKNNTITFSKSSEANINSATLPPNGCSTALDISSWIPSVARVKEALFGCWGASYYGYVCLGYDGTNVHGNMVGDGNYYADNDLAAWSSYIYRGGVLMPIVSSSIFWGEGTIGAAVTMTIKIHAITLNR